MNRDPAIERRPDGTLLLRAAAPLGPYDDNAVAPLRSWARERPDATFLRERDGDGWRTLTYAEADGLARRVASALLARGFGAATPVAILSGASIAHALVRLGATAVGIPVAPISTVYETLADDARLRAVLGALPPAAVVAAEPALHPRGLAVARALGAEVLAVDALLAAPDDPAVDAARAAVRPDDVATILFTSGSTGDPKGVVTTHRMLASNQAAMLGAWPVLGEGEVRLTDWLPWHHVFGGSHDLGLALARGGAFTIDDGRPTAEEFPRSLDALAAHPPTVYFNVPRGYALLADALEDDAGFARRFFGELRLLGVAAAATPPALWTRLRALANRYGRDVVLACAWGQTETAPMATATRATPDDPADIGLPAPGVELALVPQEGSCEARVRGPGVTPGYWRRPDLTAAAFDAEGFYRTGDALRYVVEGGRPGLRFDGRLAESFKLTSGTWVDGGALRAALLAALGELVLDAVITGAGRDEPGALLFTDGAPPDPGAIRAALARTARAAPRPSSRVARALIVPRDLSREAGERTDKGSVNQRRVLERCRPLVAALHDAVRADGEVLVLLAPAAP